MNPFCNVDEVDLRHEHNGAWFFRPFVGDVGAQTLSPKEQDALERRQQLLEARAYGRARAESGLARQPEEADEVGHGSSSSRERPECESRDGPEPRACKRMRASPGSGPPVAEAPRGSRVSKQGSVSLLPWQRFQPQTPAKIFGQAKAIDGVRSWLRAPKAPNTFAASALVLQGPPGCGKSCLARCCIKEAGFHLVEFGPHEEAPLASFLRQLGATDCEGRRICLLVEDLPQVLELKDNANAAKVKVYCPVICTADYVVKRNHAHYGSVVSMFALRTTDLRQLLDRTLAPALRLCPQHFPALIEGCRGDARQLCLQASMRAAGGRDYSRTPFDEARTLLGGRTAAAAHEAVKAADTVHQTFCLLFENFCALPRLPLRAAVEFGEVMATADVLDAAGCERPGALAGRACLLLRGASQLSKGLALADYGGWSMEKRQQAAQQNLWQRRNARLCDRQVIGAKGSVLWREKAHWREGLPF